MENGLILNMKGLPELLTCALEHFHALFQKTLDGADAVPPSWSPAAYRNPVSLTSLKPHSPEWNEVALVNVHDAQIALIFMLLGRKIQ